MSEATERPHPGKYRVALRRGDNWKVKPEAEVLDGQVFEFVTGWPIEESDSSIYVGEWAMLIRTSEFHRIPPEAPAWIASGDLTPE